MRNPILFGDYSTALTESEPRVYEDIQDYDACKALFQVLVSDELCTSLVHEHLESLNIIGVFYFPYRRSLRSTTRTRPG